MNLKTDLKVQLWAGSVLVAESNDLALWTRIFPAIAGASAGSNSNGTVMADELTRPVSGNHPPVVPIGSPLDKLAQELGVDIEVLQGACDPLPESPYMRLDMHRWAKLKENTGRGGPGAVPPMTLAATFLALWHRLIRPLQPPTIAECQAVLATIQLRDKNPHRAIRGCPWLGLAGESLRLKPDGIKRAIALAKAYCTGEELAEGMVAGRARAGALKSRNPVVTVEGRSRGHGSARMGAQGYAAKLIDQGYFSEGRQVGDIVTRARQTIGMTLDPKDVAKALLRLTRRQRLRREDASDGSGYRYVATS